MNRFVIATATLFACSVGQGIAADFDGSKLLICATTDAFECTAKGGCARGRAEEIGAPSFFRIDFAARSIVGTQRSTPIVRQEKSDGQILLQGSEHENAWSLALDSASGRVSGTLVAGDSAIVIFGGCTPR